MDVFISELAAQWETIRAAPIPFVMVMIAGLAIIWLFVNYVYSTTIISKNSQISLWKDRSLAWEKSGAGTPEEVKKLLARRWTPLSPEEVVLLRKRLQLLPKPLVVLVRCGDSDCSELGESLVSIFRSVDWNAQYEGEPTSSFVESGIVILQANDRDKSLIDAINVSTKDRLPITLQSHSLLSIRIVIGRKPN